MGNYIRTGPFTNGAAPGIQASFLNNIENVLEQPSGGSEVGDYFISYGAYAINAIGGGWNATISRTSVPVSITTDETLNAHTNCNAISSNNLNANGVHVYTGATAINTSCNVAGALTFNY